LVWWVVAVGAAVVAARYSGNAARFSSGVGGPDLTTRPAEAADHIASGYPNEQPEPYARRKPPSGGVFSGQRRKTQVAANRVARMAKHYATTESRVDEVKIGFELLLPSGIDGVPPTTFVIDGIKLIHNKAAGEPPKIRLTSDLPEGGYTVDFPLDAVVTMIVEPRGDD
jgi:hypothetical protein